MSNASKIMMGSGASGGYEIEQSLIFEGDGSAGGSGGKLSRSPSSSGNLRTWTYSTWVKIPNGGAGGIGNYLYGYSLYPNGWNQSSIMLPGTGEVQVHSDMYASFSLKTNRVIRDPAAWYHIVVEMDTTQSTAANRLKIYVNGVQETSFAIATYPGLNAESTINRSGHIHNIGYTNSYYTRLQIAETHFIDGTALTASSFGETNSATGQWIPKEYTGGSYGTNGFYLPYNKGGGGGSAYFDGSGDGINFPTNSDFNFASNNFCMEAWVYRTRANGTRSMLVNQGDNAGSNTSTSTGFYLESSNNFKASAVDASNTNTMVFITASVTNSVNTWYHVALVRNGNTLTLYQDGTSVGSATINFAVNYPSSEAWDIAKTDGLAWQSPWQGYISNVRIVNGSPVYTGNFTPSTTPLTNITNTKLLMNGGVSALVGPSLTTTGNTTFSTTQPFASSVTTFASDASGQGNNYTPTGLRNSDVVIDTPTNNFATLNPVVSATSAMVLSEGNLKGDFRSGSVANASQAVSTIAMPAGSGKWYWEMRNTYTGLGFILGIVPKGELPRIVSSGSFGYGYVNIHGKKTINGTETSYGTLWFSSGQTYIVSCYYDSDNGKVGFKLNGTDQGYASQDVTAGSYVAIFTNASGGTASFPTVVNFGQNGTFNGAVTAQGNADTNGIGDFYYAPPSGYKALCTANLPDPAITLPGEHMNTVLYNGTGSTAQTITGVGFQPDFVWIKNRPTNATNHCLYDSVRGPNKTVASSTTNAQSSDSGDGFSAFTSDGFTLKELTTAQGTQNTGATVAWNWKAGGATPAKTYAVTVVSDSGNKYRFDGFGTSAVTIDLQEGGTYTFDQSHSSNSNHPFRFSTTSNGSHGGGSEYTTGVTTYGSPGSSGAYTRITVAASAATLYYYCTNHSGMGGQANTNSTFGSTNFKGNRTAIVSANIEAGFSASIHAHNNASSDTYGHGLGVAPDLIIEKKLDVAGGDGVVQFTAVDGSADYMRLNTTAAKADAWSGMNAPTSTVYSSSVGSGAGATSVITWAFATKPGYSKVGTYVGNGATDNGPFVNLGFRPAWLLIKNVLETGNNWIILDSARDPANEAGRYINANTYAAEADADRIDLLSNGFKVKHSYGADNTNGRTYLYLAFAESPFKYANAR